MASTELTGDRKQVAALLAAEARLGVRFAAEYRDFIANRKRYTVGVKRIRFFPVTRCEWLDESKKAIAIGESFHDGLGTLCFKVSRQVASDTVYEWMGGKFKRFPVFAELVQRERENRALDDDARVRLAERLGGAARRCSCGREVRMLQVCECGRMGSRTDPPYVLSPAEHTAAAAAFPSVMRASRLVAALKAAGHVVPSGATQLLATAELLDAKAKPAALIAAWRATGMAVAVDAPTVTKLLKAVS